MDDYDQDFAHLLCQDCGQHADEYGHCHVCGEPVSDTAHDLSTNPGDDLFDKENA